MLSSFVSDLGTYYWRSIERTIWMALDSVVSGNRGSCSVLTTTILFTRDDKAASQDLGWGAFER